MTDEQVSAVVTGGAQGIGRAVAHRLSRLGPVVVIDVTEQLAGHPERLQLVTGDARDPAVAVHAAELAEQAAPLTGC